ncbi:hypothetical protein CLV58_1673 [Spirosoma oryzae]|uniref:Uncharacterized protein n=1 Tax=Spirosoma oryzae TaxID=1469603 RepID=A0A2T0REY0_9BACT|nr:hypothetical protein [Spirosoma oryzae]PRY19756.1 hypothetical protein CLV58_1673 [Spirosoma oryzae]
MKNQFLLPIAVLSFLVGGCKKEAVDPRDRYIGRFNVVGNTSSYQLESSVKPSCSSANDVLIITKGTSQKELVLSFSKNRLTATVSENGFFMPPQAQEATATNGTKFYYNYWFRHLRRDHT